MLSEGSELMMGDYGRPIAYYQSSYCQRSISCIFPGGSAIGEPVFM